MLCLMWWMIFSFLLLVFLVWRIILVKLCGGWLVVLVKIMFFMLLLCSDLVFDLFII